MSIWTHFQRSSWVKYTHFRGTNSFIFYRCQQPLMVAVLDLCSTCWRVTCCQSSGYDYDVTKCHLNHFISGSFFRPKYSLSIAWLTNLCQWENLQSSLIEFEPHRVYLMWSSCKMSSCDINFGRWMTNNYPRFLGICVLRRQVHLCKSRGNLVSRNMLMDIIVF